MQRMHPTFLAAGIAALLAACGGGGGGDGGNISLPVPSAEFTSSNAPVIASAVVGAVTDSQYVGDLSGLAVPTSAASGGVTVAGIDLGTPPVLEASLGPEVQQCGGSGTTSFSAEIANPGTLTAGDSLSFTFSECDQGDGVRLNGGFSFAITALQGDVAAGMLRLTITVTLADLSFFAGGESTTMTGDLSLTIDTLTNASMPSITVAANSLSVTSTAGSVSLTDYSLALSTDPLLGTSTLAVEGVVTASAFDGRVEISTTTALAFDATGNPVDGEIVIEGANGATITIDVVSPDEVDLLIDLDGNGTIDEVIPTTWSDLLG